MPSRQEMLQLGVLFLTQMLVTPVLGQPHSLMCKDCEYADKPEDCQIYSHCKHGGCVTEVYHYYGKNVYTFRCAVQDECFSIWSIFGKRAAPKPGHGHDLQPVCQKCCDTNLCQSYSCLGYVTTSTHAPTTLSTVKTTLTTTHATTTDSCRDYESDTFRCAAYEKYNFCTDPSPLAYAIAHDKCARHCGFCGLPTTHFDPATATTTHYR